MHLMRNRAQFLVALIPATVWGVWNVGLQANRWLLTHPDMLPAQNDARFLGANLASHHNPDVWTDNLLYGSVYFFSILLAAMLGAGFVEGIRSLRSGRKFRGDFALTSLLFALLLPPTLPLPWVTLGMGVGASIAYLIALDDDRLMLHPAALAWLFLLFVIPEKMSGDTVWTVADGFVGATPLALVREGGIATLNAAGITWWDLFIGRVQGATGEVPVAALLVGAVYLLVTRKISWRLIVGVIAGLVSASFLFNLAGSSSNPMNGVPWYWHAVLGSLVLGCVFVAADPLIMDLNDTAAMLCGVVLGGLVVSLRVLNPAYPDGVMFAILLMMLGSGIIRFFVLSLNRPSVAG